MTSLARASSVGGTLPPRRSYGDKLILVLPSCRSGTSAIAGSEGKRNTLAQFTRSYSLTTALAPFTLRVWLTICLWAALLM